MSIFDIKYKIYKPVDFLMQSKDFIFCPICDKPLINTWGPEWSPKQVIYICYRGHYNVSVFSDSARESWNYSHNNIKFSFYNSISFIKSTNDLCIKYKVARNIHKIFYFDQPFMETLPMRVTPTKNLDVDELNTVLLLS